MPVGSNKEDMKRAIERIERTPKDKVLKAIECCGILIKEVPCIEDKYNSGEVYFSGKTLDRVYTLMVNVKEEDKVIIYED